MCSLQIFFRSHDRPALASAHAGLLAWFKPHQFCIYGAELSEGFTMWLQQQDKLCLCSRRPPRDSYIYFSFKGGVGVNKTEGKPEGRQ